MVRPCARYVRAALGGGQEPPRFVKVREFGGLEGLRVGDSCPKANELGGDAALPKGRFPPAGGVQSGHGELQSCREFVAGIEAEGIQNGLGVPVVECPDFDHQLLRPDAHREGEGPPQNRVEDLSVDGPDQGREHAAIRKLEHRGRLAKPLPPQLLGSRTHAQRVGVGDQGQESPKRGTFLRGHELEEHPKRREDRAGRSTRLGLSASVERNPGCMLLRVFVG